MCDVFKHHNTLSCIPRTYLRKEIYNSKRYVTQKCVNLLELSKTFGICSYFYKGVVPEV